MTYEELIRCPGVPPREEEIKAALYEELRDIEEVERIFRIIKQQPEY